MNLAAILFLLGITPAHDQDRRNSRSVYYGNCDAARAAGAAPIRRGQPGYAPHLDRDNDGIACEPRRRRRGR